MKVKELIEQLKKYNNLDDEIISVYWTYDDVSDSYDDLDKSHWLELVSRFDDHDFQHACDDIHDVLHEVRGVNDES
tara:strand:- start:243 stop:470 length:228 start_codon:yes stop_codon:yes gene_type:complete